MKENLSDADAKALASAAFAERFDDADRAQVKVTLHDYGRVPGVRVFEAITAQAGLRENPNVGLRGVIVGQKVITDRVERLTALVDAMRAAGLEGRPNDFADLAARVEGEGRDGVEALIEPLTLANYKASNPALAAQMFMPRKATVDGSPAIEYYALSPATTRRGPTRIVMPEGKPAVRSKQGPDGGWKVDEGFAR